MKNGRLGEDVKYVEPRSSPTCCEKFGQWIKDNLLLVLIIIGVVLALLIGFLLKEHSSHDFTKREVYYISFPGVLFLNMLKMLIIPLIVTSVVAGLATLDVSTAGRMGWRTVLYYFCTTILAVILGIILVVAIHPGKGNPDDMVRSGQSKQVKAEDAFMDLLRNIFPPNLIGATMEKYKTFEPEVEDPGETTLNATNGTADNDAMLLIMSDAPKGGMVSGMNVLGIIVFSIALGVTIAKMGELGTPLVIWFVALNEAVMRIVWIVMWYSPIGIMFLVLGRVLGMDDWATVAGQLGMYCVTVITGLLIHGLIVLPLAYLIFARKNPIKFLLNVLPALLTAFGTASSSATLPLTTKNLEENNNIDKRVTRFVLPIGATINMDGTALYEAVAAIFVAQYNDISLDAGQVITISITATIASIGAAGIPQAGLVTMVIVFTAVGLPLEDIALILSVDIILDRIRTMINVEGDSIGAGIVAKMAKKQLDEYDQHDLAHEMTPLQSGLTPNTENAPPRYDETLKDKKWNKPSSSWNENAGCEIQNRYRISSKHHTSEDIQENQGLKHSNSEDSHYTDKLQKLKVHGKCKLNCTEKDLDCYAKETDQPPLLRFKASQDLDTSAIPVVHPPKMISASLCDKLRKTLEVMEKQKVLHIVDEPPDWVNSMVVVEKPKTGKPHICLDPRDLKKAIK
uniref:Amino acid transporter n=1 Tax=Saccoglossus kowalevskii TaxID=10224 RepID=A0ABM0M981_SACKO|nr:PREDICTED: excitatory amino acid transporter 1-like [Saccoglossus kowalevskii]